MRRVPLPARSKSREFIEMSFEVSVPLASEKVPPSREGRPRSRWRRTGQLAERQHNRSDHVQVRHGAIGNLRGDGSARRPHQRFRICPVAVERHISAQASRNPSGDPLAFSGSTISSPVDAACQAQVRHVARSLGLEAAIEACTEALHREWCKPQPPETISSVVERSRKAFCANRPVGAVNATHNAIAAAGVPRAPFAVAGAVIAEANVINSSRSSGSASNCPRGPAMLSSTPFASIRVVVRADRRSISEPIAAQRQSASTTKVCLPTEDDRA